MSLTLLAAVALVCNAHAEDQITKKDGTIVSGKVGSVSDGQVSFTQGNARTAIYLTDIQKVTMAAPEGLAQSKDAAPAQVVATLAPLVKDFAGLPTDWVLDAMTRLADAYDALNQPDKSAAVYAQISQLYAGTGYQKLAVVGQAKAALKAGNTAVALSAVQPLVDEANKNIAPSADEGRLFAGAFLVYGQVLEVQKQYPQALEAFLTVKTMFYQNLTLVADAEAKAQALRTQHPDVSIE